MPLTSSVMRQSISNFRLYCCSKKIQMLRKNVKLLLEQLQVFIFAEIVFGVSPIIWQRNGVGEFLYFGSVTSYDCLSEENACFINSQSLTACQKQSRLVIKISRHRVCVG